MSASNLIVIRGNVLLTCSKCGNERFFRRHRSAIDKFLYSGLYQCKDCGVRQKVPRWKHWYWFSPTVQCPVCGTSDVTRRKSRDWIDRMYCNPLSRFQQLFGAPIYHCLWCRVQFYDLRPMAGNAAEKESAGA